MDYSRLKHNTLKRISVPSAAVLSALAIAACGDTVHANRAHLGTCGKNTFNMAGKNVVIAPSELIKTAAQDVLALQQRALDNNGSINLPRYQSVTEIVATINRLTLNFHRPNGNDYPWTDHIIFPTQHDSTHVTLGAIACYQNNTLYENGTFETLQQYANETAILDK